MPKPESGVSNSNALDLQKIGIEKERLELEKKKAAADQKFLNKHFATIVTALLSATAVFVSGSQVWLAKIQKDRDVELQHLQQEQQRSFEAAKFIFEHQQQLFSTNSNERNILREVIFAAFPKTVTAPLLSRLDVAQERVQSPDILRQFLKPDGSTVNEANQTSLKAWMERNGIDSDSITMFLHGDRYRDARLKATRDLGLTSATMQTIIHDVPDASLSSVVQSFTDDGASDVKTAKQTNGLWTITVTREK